MQTSQPEFYQAFTNGLTQEQITTIQNFITTANNRQAQSGKFY